MKNKTRICSKCKEIKSIEEFNFRYKIKEVRLPYCRECGRVLTRNHYQNNKTQYYERNLREYKKRREFVRKLKEKPCADCGIEYPFYVMDYDHREDETKLYSLNQVERLTMKKIKAEIAKCDVVCANCHRERTYQRMLKRKKEDD